MSTRFTRFRAHAWEPLTMTWAEVADAVFRRDEAWLRANLPADFPRADPLYGLFHVEAVEAWARRHWGIASPEDTSEDGAARMRERMHVKKLRASGAVAAASADGDQIVTAESEPANYRVSKLAERWNCSPNKIRGLITDGDLLCLRLGKLIRIPAAAVHAYEAACEIRPKPAPAEAEAVTDAALRDAASCARARGAARRFQAR